MTEIITRLLLKTDGFNANLENAKKSIGSFQSDISNKTSIAGKSINNFQGSISSMSQIAGSGLIKFAGAIGIAATASEGLMKTIRATQGTSDEFDNRMNACKDSVNSFFESLSSGDFSYFEDGLMSVFQRAKDLSATLDTLGDIVIGVDTKGMYTENAIQKNLNVIRNKDSGKEEIEQAKENNKKLLAEYGVYVDAKVKASKDALLKMYGVKAGIKDANLGDVAVYLAGGNAHLYDNAINKYNKDLEALNGKLKNVIHESGTSEELSNRTVAIRKEIAEYKEKNATIRKLSTAMNTITDDEREEIVKLNKELEATNKLYGMMEAKVIRGDKAGSTGVGVKSNEKPKENSLAWYDAELSKLNKELSTATTMEARAAVQKTIDELQRQKINLKIVVQQEAFKLKYGEMKDAELMPTQQSMPGIISSYGAQIAMYEALIKERQQALAETTDIQASSFIQSQIDKLRETLNELQKASQNVSVPGGVYSALRNNAGNKKQGSFDLRNELPNMKLSKPKSPIKKSDIELNEKYDESLSAIGDTMGSLSGLFNNNTSSVLQWGASLIGTIAQAIPKIVEMTAANELEAVSAQKTAASNTIAAGSEVLKAHAGIPFVGIALGIAGVAAIVAAMASMPKFETGGIVPGTMFSGDKVPTWLNSGEMVLIILSKVICLRCLITRFRPVAALILQHLDHCPDIFPRLRINNL